MNTKRNFPNHRLGLSLALIALLCFASGCGSVMPTAPALDAANSSQVSRSAGADIQIGDDESIEGGEPFVVSGGTDIVTARGAHLGQGHGNRKPKKH